MLLEATLQVAADLRLGLVDPLAPRRVRREEHPGLRAVAVVLGVALRPGRSHGLIVTWVQLQAEPIHTVLEGVAVKKNESAFNALPHRVVIHGSHYLTPPTPCAASWGGPSGWSGAG